MLLEIPADVTVHDQVVLGNGHSDVALGDRLTTIAIRQTCQSEKAIFLAPEVVRAPELRRRHKLWFMLGRRSFQLENVPYLAGAEGCRRCGEGAQRRTMSPRIAATSA